jgi:hypothetical protein
MNCQKVTGIRTGGDAECAGSGTSDVVCVAAMRNVSAWTEPTIILEKFPPYQFTVGKWSTLPWCYLHREVVLVNHWIE